MRTIPQFVTETRYTLLCDVENPLIGREGATAVFAPQKGAGPEMCRRLEAGVTNIARILTEQYGSDISSIPGGGAAGGAGAGLSLLPGAGLSPGAETLLHLTGVWERIAHADLVLTGEGCSDRQTLRGKLPGAVLKVAESYGVPCMLFSGQIMDMEALLNAGFTKVISINDIAFGEERDMNPLDPVIAKSRLERSVSGNL